MNRTFRDFNEFIRFMGKNTAEVDAKMAIALKAVAVNTEKHIKSVMGDNTKLAPNAPSTIERKGFDAPLVHTGEMRDSLEVQATTYESAVGTSDEKMYWHEYGLGRNYPERPAMFEGTQEATEENQAIIIEAAQSIVGERGIVQLIAKNLGERA